MCEMWLLSYLLSFIYRICCGNDARNKSLCISNLKFLIWLYCALRVILCASLKILQWKLKAVFLLLLCSFYFILSRSFLKTGLECISFKTILLICLANFTYVFKLCYHVTRSIYECTKAFCSNVAFCDNCRIL